MAAGRYGGGYGGSYQGYGSYDSRFYSDYDAYGSGGSGGYDYDNSYGGGYWGQESAGGDYEDPAAKKRKMSNLTVCVDHLRGYCAKGPRCPKAHVDYVESSDEREMMAKVKFCHDFQNKGVCTRQNCRFLHVTRREEDEFLLTGQVPQTVFERKNDYGEDGDYEGGDAQSFDQRPPFSRPMRGRGGARGGWSPRGGGAPRGGHRPGPPSWQSSWSRGSDDYSYNRSRSFEGPSYEATKEGHRSSMPVTFSNFCIDFLKGTCGKEKCQLQHVQMVEEYSDRENISKNVFCHDFLNWKCPRQFCKYLHATNDEQKVFVDHGYFTPALRQRNKEKLFYSDVCIDYLRNQCVRGDNCQYSHVEFVEGKEERICLSRSIFCHDHQEGRCDRYNCKLIHTDKNDEDYFIRSGALSENLKATSSTVEIDPYLESLAATVCREFVKNKCNRGPSCKFYHPPADEVARLVAYRRSKSLTGSTNSSATDGTSANEITRLQQENKELKERAHQLERLLADACHCITLAVGDQNPAIQTLMQTIATMAPESSLASNKDEEIKATGEAGLSQDNTEQPTSATSGTEVP